MIERSHRPKDTGFYQQTSKGWRPILTIRQGGLFFLVTGVIFLGIGLAIFFPDRNVVEVSIDYTNCTNGTEDAICAYGNTTCVCTLPLVIPQDVTGPVYFYYGMKNFYQNHRKFSSSIDISNLMGSSPPGSSCAPLIKDPSGKYYAPCGQNANAIFNDTFSLMNDDINVTVPWTSTNISLPSDRNKLPIITDWNNTVKPPNWRKTQYERSSNSYKGDEELLVWLRPAALPSFKKLHRILKKTGKFSNGLMAGNYTLTVNYYYPVSSFGGKKLFIITNLSWIGGKNSALSLLYLTTGCLELVIGIVLLFMSIKHSTTRPKSDQMMMSTRM